MPPTSRARLALSAAAALIAAAGAAHAGPIVITPIVLQGDTYGFDQISSGFSASENHAINNAGMWVVESDTTNFDTDIDGIVIRGTGHMRPGMTLFNEGQPIESAFPPPPDTAFINSFDSITINASGNSAFNFFLSGTPGGSFDSGVYFNSQLVIQESTHSTAAGFSPNTPYTGWFEVRINDQNQILMVASVNDPGLAGSTNRGLVIVDNPAGPFTETVIAKQGDELIPGRFVTDFSTGAHASAFRNNSRTLFLADMDGDIVTDGLVCHYDGSTITILAQEGMPSAVAGRNWGALLGAPLDVNNSGQWVMRGDLDGGTTDDSLIVRNGTDVIAREGHPVPTELGAFTFTNFGTGAVKIADNGDVIYFATWNDPDTTRNQGIFVNNTILVQKGVTEVLGATFSAISAVESNFSASPDGRWIVFEGNLTGFGAGAFLIERTDLACPADFDGNGTVAVPDIFAFLAAWFAGDASADFDDNGLIQVPDIFAFLAAWFAGCP